MWRGREGDREGMDRESKNKRVRERKIKKYTSVTYCLTNSKIGTDERESVYGRYRGRMRQKE